MNDSVFFSLVVTGKHAATQVALAAFALVTFATLATPASRAVSQLTTGYASRFKVGGIV